MSPLQVISSIFSLAAIGLFGRSPALESALVVVSAFALVALVTYLESSKGDEHEELKLEVKRMKDTLQALMVRAGLGR